MGMRPGARRRLAALAAAVATVGAMAVVPARASASSPLDSLSAAARQARSEPSPAGAPTRPAAPATPVPAVVSPPPPSVAAAAAHDGQAALVIAAALDAYLPALRASASSPTQKHVSGCDLLDEPPLLCVGSEADNTYAQSVMVRVDFGGDDTYLDGAGAAPFAVPGTPALVPVSLNVDLGGNDTYSMTSADTTLVTSYGLVLAPDQTEPVA